MSDSETDLFPRNVYTFQNETTVVSAKGPSVNSTNMTGINLRSNPLSSTMQSRNFERQRYVESSYDQRSMYYRRETSPMSMYSGSDIRSRNLHNSFYPGGTGSQRSMHSRRGLSPVSMRSIDSNASVSAVDIALAFKNVNFNKYDLRIIKDAYNKLMKRKVRKKIEKRRNMRLFLKGHRRKSGYDSGELGSDSSISSSDDCRSTKSAMYSNNMSTCRSTKTDITNIRKSLKESNMYKDCTENIKNNSYKNMLSAHPRNNMDILNNTNISTDIHNASKITNADTQKLPNINQNLAHTNMQIERTKQIQNLNSTAKNIPKPAQGASNFNQRDRFKNGFLLPSQRFNKSIASVTISEKDTTHSQSMYNKEGKRNLEMENISESKRKKLSNSQKQSNSTNKTNIKVSNVLTECNNNKNAKNSEKVNDFEFIKPKIPTRKSGQEKIKEMLISKSNVPLTDAIAPTQLSVRYEDIQAQKLDTTGKKADNQPEVIENTDVSMRPSFIKRKLFTQKSDVTESKNLSIDAMNINSPQTDVYSAIQREKHKARKVVTNQSCLNRDVNQEENNFLDLIHKIVPPDRMNMTNVSNKTCRSSKNSLDNKQVDDDKWDVTSIISTCNNDDVSDTYTDEEIFSDNKKTRKNKKSQPVKNRMCKNECKVVLEQILPKQTTVNNNISIDNKTKSLYNCAKSFWDTDFESDFESTALKSSEQKSPKKGNIITTNNVKTIQDGKSKVKQLQNPFNENVIVDKQLGDNEMKKGTLKKYNINKNLTIKAFGTPNLPKNNMRTPKTQNETLCSKEGKKNVSLYSTDKPNIDKKITDNPKNIQNVAPKMTREKSNISQNMKTNKVNKEDKIKIPPKSSNDIASVVSSKVHRTPKKKLNKENTTIHTDHQTKSKPDNKVTNNKLKAAKKPSDRINDKENKTQTRKKASVADLSIIQNEPMNRTLRTRTIDLSSSFNTSSENITNLTVRSLRTRRINLSSSINNSSLEGKQIAMKKKIPNPSKCKTK